MKRYLRFCATYLASPVFNSSLDSMGHVDINNLGLPDDLMREIKGWDQIFQNTFCEEYPPDSGFSSIQDVESHNIEGIRLCKRLGDFLGPDYIVEFVPQKL